LWLSSNAISDVTSLVGLTALSSLSLGGNPNLSDVGPLSGLTSLTALDLYSTAVTNVSALSSLTNLEFLDLRSLSLVDIAPLAGLTALTSLYLRDNSITDISSLVGLSALSNLLLGYNPNLADIQPLLDNVGLGAGDSVELTSTSVSCTAVAALEAKGVTVASSCG